MFVVAAVNILSICLVGVVASFVVVLVFAVCAPRGGGEGGTTVLSQMRIHALAKFRLVFHSRKP